MRRPTVVVVTRRMMRKNRPVDYLGEAHFELLVRLKILPVVIPPVSGVLACLPQYMETMSGLLLAEGDDIDPTRYQADRPTSSTWNRSTP